MNTRKQVPAAEIKAPAAEIRAKDAEIKARERLRTLADSLRRAAKHPGEAESIHRLRVSIRRFTQVLRVFEGVFHHSGKMRRQLKGLLALCGAARDCDVAAEVLAEAGVPADLALEQRLKQRRERAGRHLAKLLTKGDAGTSMRHWREWLKAKSGHKAASVPQVLPSLSHEFMAAGRAAAKAGARFGQMHKFRLLVKRYRYTLEILGGKAPAGIRMETLRNLQERLGAINDCVTTAGLMDDLHLGTAEKRRIKVALNRLLARRAAAFRAYWRSQFKPKLVPRRTK
jgi:CHAD domain-containing protein